ncbi:MAG: O-antigen ligase family protein [Patescibacteria group bacterium]
MRILKLLLLSTILTILPGQLIRVNITPASAISISDVVILFTNIIFCLVWFFEKKTLVVPGAIFIFGWLFIMLALSINLFSLNFYDLKAIVIASLFLIRLILYFNLALIVLNVVNRRETESFVSAILLAGGLFTLLGFIQLVVFPDLSGLQLLGWDPHIGRLVSTTLDPNYTGLMLTIFTSISISKYLYGKKKLHLILSIIFTLAVLLTFSRSTYIAYIAMMFTIGLIKSPKIILVALILFVTAFFTVPQINQRISGAFRVDETATARIESWQKAWVIYTKNPIFGVGFNNYRTAQEKYGFFETETQQLGHAGGGSDSTFLLVAATSGFIGAAVYLLWQASILISLKKNITKNYIAVATMASYVALLFHTQFVNSLLYPQIMLLVWTLISLKLVYDD